ncbi:RecB family exonuclease [Caloramator proteoclasticus]|uniref:RecB family exonuclease n=1 Tax=Caloramator proteoclasticus DSM 10124 TaxID=1121262 RepID=A0A1M5BAC8_9CLOT|nr:PD-(D/E)XK nuclease family protein [Caloramator proteoclasticus]SHF39390.1 RecB family exonuclease [Caloramator proteoclasticus DSM 10124]
MQNKIYLSASSINIFKTCKRRYKYKYIDKLNKDTKLESKFISFGQSIHKAIADFNSIQNKEFKTLQILQNLLRKNWNREGYEGIDEEREFGLKGLKMLEEYFYNPQDIATENLLIENTIKEYRNNNIILIGKIDRAIINLNNEIEIIDYKTGNTIEFGGDFVLDPQIAIYTELFKNNFNKVPDYVSFYYLAHNKKVQIKIEPQHINLISEFLNDTTNDIITEKELPCNVSESCEYTCEFCDICDKSYNIDEKLLDELKTNIFNTNRKSI